ncbi:HNH endonuclease, partial [Arthrobacter sp. AK01]|uniref:HNH endonuclease signature motif containing protein n=1 Tax=Arthrobacter sp. AK01 TaxID=2894084 RepID=UPI001E5C9639
MGIIGQIVARRASSPRANDLLSQPSLRSVGGPARVAAFEGTTAVGTVALSSEDAGLLGGLGTETGASDVGPGGGVHSADVAPGLRVIPTADSKRVAGLIEAGLPSPGMAGVSLAQADEALRSLRESASDEASVFGFVEAADFAGKVEEISRSVEYLQIVAAHAVERTRLEAQNSRPGSSAAAPEWRTGWTETPEEPTSGTGATVPEATVPDATVPAGEARSTNALSMNRSRSKASVLDDGYRNAAEFLRARLRIGIGEARRRLALAAEVLPQKSMTGQEIPARRGMLAEALGSALVPSRSATIISTALDKVRNLTDEDTITRMEHALTTTATESDPDFVTTMTKRWADRIDHDGPEPSEEILHQLQGAFLRRRRRHGLHHLEIFATDEQIETLTTTMNAATNPRLTNSNSTSTNRPGTGTSPDLDRRSRAQKLLDGLTGACALAMTTGKLPSNGGLRPQLTVTIDHRDLLEQLTGTGHHQPGTRTQTGTSTGTAAGIGSGTATFTGPMHPTTIRKIACDADIIPVLLGTDSRVLDIGRTTRIFPPHIRKAITARDQGCAFPDCTMPAPWCEAHHTTYWTHGGTTGTNNGTLLCSHHHHLIHKEQWRIDMTTGVPWFIPPPHIDPQQ